MRALATSLTWGLLPSAVAVLLATANPARADHCDPVLLAPHGEGSWTAAVRGEAARFDNDHAAGSWLGVRAEAGAGLGDFHLRGWLPLYSLERDGVRHQGLGDVGLAGQWRALGASDNGWSAGPALSVTAPTGSAGEGLGMGHTMLMPGLWGTMGAGAWRVSGLAAYGRALGGGGEGHAHHHAAMGSLVDPMNRSELVASLGLGWSLAESLRAEAAALAAAPVATGDGRERVRGGLGLAWVRGSFEVAAGVELPLVGDFFRVRSSLTVSARN